MIKCDDDDGRSGGSERYGDMLEDCRNKGGGTNSNGRDVCCAYETRDTLMPPKSREQMGALTSSDVYSDIYAFNRSNTFTFSCRSLSRAFLLVIALREGSDHERRKRDDSRTHVQHLVEVH